MMRSDSITGTLSPFSREVVPSYKDMAASILGIGELVLGCVIIILACASFGVQAFGSTGGCALLAGIATLGCGGFSVISGKHKEVMVISATALMAAVAEVFSFALLIAAGIGIREERNRWSTHSLATRETVDVIAMILAIITCCVLIGSLMLCFLALFYGCFRRNAGAKYVRDHSNMPASEESRQPAAQVQTQTQNGQPEINTAPAGGQIAVLQVA